MMRMSAQKAVCSPDRSWCWWAQRSTCGNGAAQSLRGLTDYEPAGKHLAPDHTVRSRNVSFFVEGAQSGTADTPQPTRVAVDPTAYGGYVGQSYDSRIEDRSWGGWNERGYPPRLRTWVRRTLLIRSPCGRVGGRLHRPFRRLPFLFVWNYTVKDSGATCGRLHERDPTRCECPRHPGDRPALVHSARDSHLDGD